MAISTILSGVNGALGLYSGVKGIIDSKNAAKKQERLLERTKALEDSWYRRNYYGDYLNSSSSRAAIKRVENTLRRQNEQNRAYAAINGITPEVAMARNQQGLNSLENVMTNLAAQEDSRRRSVDAAHLQNQQAIANQELSNLTLDEKNSAMNAANGFSLFKDALMGVNWGKEQDDEELENEENENIDRNG